MIEISVNHWGGILLMHGKRCKRVSLAYFTVRLAFFTIDAGDIPTIMHDNAGNQIQIEAKTREILTLPAVPIPADP